jgi:hypothetical protein
MVFVMAVPKSAPYVAAGGAGFSLALVAIFSSISGPKYNLPLSLASGEMPTISKSLS